MPNATYQPALSVGGVSIQKTVTRTGDHPNPYEVTLPVGYSLSSWVKTDSDTGAGNLAGGHGQTSGTYDVYWTGGRRYGMAGTVTVNALALDGGSGDAFPASADTTVVACKQVQINTAIDGDNIQIIGMSADIAGDATATSKAHVTFKDVGAAAIANIDLAANAPVIWDIYAGVTNPFTGNPITVAYASNGNATYAVTLRIVSLEDSTP